MNVDASGDQSGPTAIVRARTMAPRAVARLGALHEGHEPAEAEQRARHVDRGDRPREHERDRGRERELADERHRDPVVEPEHAVVDEAEQREEVRPVVAAGDGERAVVRGDHERRDDRDDEEQAVAREARAGRGSGATAVSGAVRAVPVVRGPRP